MALPTEHAIAAARAFPCLAQVVHWPSKWTGGGFSGSAIWRLEAKAGVFALRAWEPDITPIRLNAIHEQQILATEAGLQFIPRLAPTRAATSWHAAAGRLWEVSGWMPGEPNLDGNWSSELIAEALCALASLHDVWMSAAGRQLRSVPSPAVLRRLARLREWPRWRDRVDLALTRMPDCEQSRLLLEAQKNLTEQASSCIRELAAWEEVALPVQPILGDPWSEHFLFCGPRLTGLVDFGGVAEDCAVVDVARLLGSALEAAPERLPDAVRMWQRLRPLNTAEEQLLCTLLRTGPIIAMETWLRRLQSGELSQLPTDRVAGRLKRILGYNLDNHPTKKPPETGGGVRSYFA